MLGEKNVLVYVLRNYCDVDARGEHWLADIRTFLRHDPARELEFRTELSSAIQLGTLSPAEYERLTGEDFDTPEDLAAWLEEFYRELFDESEGARLRAVALQAVAALLPRKDAEAFIAALKSGAPGKFRVRRTRVLATSGDDEEWWQTMRFVELALEGQVLIFESYQNTATVIGASQRYDCQIRSDAPPPDVEPRLEAWLAEWKALRP